MRAPRWDSDTYQFLMVRNVVLGSELIDYSRRISLIVSRRISLIVSRRINFIVSDRINFIVSHRINFIL